MRDPQSPPPWTAAALASSALIMAYQVAARATRDTLYLSVYSDRTLPLMLAATALPAIVAALLATRALVRLGPARFVPAALVGSAALTLAEWALVARQPGPGAIVVFLHVGAITPVLLSGLWTSVNEGFDPRAAKRSFGRIAAVGTLGGVAGAAVAVALANRLSVSAVLPALAALQLACAWSARALLAGRPRAGAPAGNESLSAGEAARRLAGRPYLRLVALLVLGSSVCATLLDLVFWSRTAHAAHHSLDKMHVFSTFYAVVSVATFVVQAFGSQVALEESGVAPTVGSLPASLAAGGLAALLLPGSWGASVARGLGSVARGSLFRSGYDVLFNVVPQAERRATKTFVDAGCDRLGDMLGSGVYAFLALVAPAGPAAPALVTCVVLAQATLLLVTRLPAGYVRALEEGLRTEVIRPQELDLGERTTRLTVSRVLEAAPREDAPALLAELRAGDPARVRAALADATPLDPALVPQVVQLLADERVKQEVTRALAAVAPAHVGQLADALLDPASPLLVRMRIPRLLATCADGRAVDGLTRGLADERFDVRYACGRALAHQAARPGAVALDRARVLDAVIEEARRERGVWQSQHLLAALPDAGEEAYVDEFLRERAGRSLEHVFTLLSLVLAREPLRLAFRALLSDDAALHGRALEYLENVLPDPVREVLWPHLEPGRPRSRADEAAESPERRRARVLDELLRSNASIELSLDALRRKHGTPGSPPQS